MIDIVKLFTPFSTLGEKSLSFEDKKKLVFKKQVHFQKKYNNRLFKTLNE